jgi:8-oxo-dGTP pyrophosphatase MutT (NUDIX family)
MIEEGELPEATATRECLEETGYLAAIYIKHEPYIGKSDFDDNIVAVYRAKALYVRTPTHTHEGEVVWLTPQELVTGNTFPEFNKAALKHFGIKY